MIFLVLLLFVTKVVIAAPIAIGTQENQPVHTDQGRAGQESWKIHLTSAVLSYDAEKFNKVYTYEIKRATSTVSVILNGIGSSWFVWAQGGEVVFNLNGEGSIYLRKNYSIGSSFDFSVTSPTINITNLPMGSTAFVFIDGVK